MNGWELDHQKRADIEMMLQGILWCIPIPFLMGLKIGIDFYILGPAYFLAVIRQRRWQLPALSMATLGILLLPTEVVRWKYGVLIGLFWIEERYLDHYKPLWPFAKRCCFYVLGLLLA
ncbi:MAG: hypothetical protein IJ274_15435, partial [Lachnospiraceae bacterium]|nr:hypothetical protein [Lachnospiraceae bacterium]